MGILYNYCNVDCIIRRPYMTIYVSTSFLISFGLLWLSGECVVCVAKCAIWPSKKFSLKCLFCFSLGLLLFLAISISFSPLLSPDLVQFCLICEFALLWYLFCFATIKWSRKKPDPVAKLTKHYCRAKHGTNETTKTLTYVAFCILQRVRDVRWLCFQCALVVLRLL